MNEELERRWRSDTLPFDGHTLATEDGVPALDVRRFLIKAIECLEPIHGSSKLYKIDDWHEHDGFVTSATPVTWSELRSWLASDQRLFIARSGEVDVYVGIYPEDYSFYLRFYLDQEILPPGRPLEGAADLSASFELVSYLQGELEETTIESATTRWRRRYGG